jgi:hypothetical protein
MNLASLNRWQAAGIHLCLSALIAATAVVVMFALWYPRPYFEAMGGQTLLALVVGVDVTLGPLLTLIVFNPKKKELKLDLAVIAAFQVAALAYGVWVTFVARPVYTAFVKDRFDIVTSNDLDATDLDAGPANYRNLSFTGPRLIGVRLPTDPKEQLDLVFSAIAGKDAQKFPKYYVPYADVAPAVIERAKPVEALVKKYMGAQDALHALASESGRPESELGYVPLHGRERIMTAVIDKRDGRVVGILSFNPY